MFRALRVGVVIPAFNESRAIATTVSTLPAFVDDVIVIDDCSDDETSAHALRSGRHHLEVIRHAQNRGVGAAISTGYRRALELGVDVAIVMGGDGQMDPADLPALLAPIADGRADYVKGNRFAHPEIWRAMPPTRLAGNVMMSLATKITSGYRHVFDSQCGYTAITRATLSHLAIDELFPRYGYPNDLLAHLNALGARVVDVPVRPIYGPHWKSGINVKTIVHPIPWVLLRSWSRRLIAKASGGWRMYMGADGGAGTCESLRRGAAHIHGDESSGGRRMYMGADGSPANVGGGGGARIHADELSGGHHVYTGAGSPRAVHCIGVVTTSYPRFAGDPAGGFVAGHVEALRALGHRVDVIAAGDGVSRHDSDRATRVGLDGDHTDGRVRRHDNRADAARTRLDDNRIDGHVRRHDDRADAARTRLDDNRIDGHERRDDDRAGRNDARAESDDDRSGRNDVPFDDGEIVRITERTLFYRGGAPDLIEASPVRSAIAAVAFTARLTAAVSRRAHAWDSIITHWLVPSAIAALPTDVPLLAIAHGGDIHTLRRMRLLAPTLFALRARGARLAFVSEDLRAISKAEAPALAKWIDDAIVQPMGIAIERFRALSRAPSHPPTLVIASRLVPVKGIDVAIAAMEHIRAPARLVIAGEGPARPTLVQKSAELTARPLPFGVSERVTFLGQVPTGERDRLLREASAVIVPSRVTPSGRTEGTPTIALEALAAGVPVIASAVGGLRELSEIRLVPPDDPRALAFAIDHTLADPPPASRLRAAVAHLDWERVVEQLR